MPEKLVFVDSMHEQREFNNRIVPLKGCWLEIGDFVPVIEKFTIRERWKCVDVREAGVGDDITMAVELKRLDHQSELAECKVIIDRIMSKHGDSLVDSLRYMIVSGLSTRSNVVNNFRKKQIAERLALVGIGPKSEEAQLLIYQKRLATAQKKVDNIKFHISSMNAGAQQ